jgi:hypothetical protein
MTTAMPFAAHGAEKGILSGNRFTIAVIPDSQNYVDYTHQRDAGFPFDARDMFAEQLQYVVDHAVSNGGDIAFLTSVGDVWQHQSLPIDPGHAARGFKFIPNPLMEKRGFVPTQKVFSVEIPAVRLAYDKIAGKMPFSVAPGNHDYDAMWTDANHPPSQDSSSTALSGVIHPGGLSNFRSVFSDQSPYFKNKPWYVASHDGGADSAQIFTAGGYHFLHIGLQFDPPDASLDWAASVIRRHHGLPTIISTHDFLDTQGRRLANPIIDSHMIDPMDNDPDMMWQKLISQHDQIFLVLCGHEHAQAYRADPNQFGHQVYQVLADYQARGQTAIDAGVKFLPGEGIGDGWIRLMTFDMSGAAPSIQVRTYSTHYNKTSADQPNYTEWYKPHEKPGLTDDEFLKSEDYVIDMVDFHQRFDKAAKVGMK